MANLDDDTPPMGGGANGTPEASTPAAPDQHIKALEQENARLRNELTELRARHDRDRELLGALLLEGMPRDEKEFQEMLANSVSFSDVLRQFEQEFGAGS